KPGAQGLARTRQPRLHRAHCDAERKSDLFVAQAVDLAQDDGGALIERQRVERVLKRFAELLLRQHAIGSRFGAAFELTVRLDVRVERDLVGTAAAPP